jgi:hypothetical protein
MGRWGKAKGKFWKDWERVEEGLGEDLKVSSVPVRPIPLPSASRADHPSRPRLTSSPPSSPTSSSARSRLPMAWRTSSLVEGSSSKRGSRRSTRWDDKFRSLVRPFSLYRPTLCYESLHGVPLVQMLTMCPSITAPCSGSRSRTDSGWRCGAGGRGRTSSSPYRRQPPSPLDFAREEGDRVYHAEFVAFSRSCLVLECFKIVRPYVRTLQ